jgi:hypothetical protein
MSIEPHLGDLEYAYRQEYLSADRSLVTYASVCWVVFTLFFIRSAALFFGQSQLFSILLVSRAFYSLITVFMVISLYCPIQNGKIGSSLAGVS